MAHHLTQSGYRRLVERLNRFPQGAPPSATLFKILAVLFSEKEADLVSRLPIKPFTARTAARAWKVPAGEAQKILDSLAGRCLLVDAEHDGAVVYTLPPPMAGFFEFSLMRVRRDIDQKLLSELFYQYLNVEEEFIRALFTGETKPGRVFVYEEALTAENALHILDFERASEVVKMASAAAVGVCFCRHKMSHVGRSCAASLDICMTFNDTAASLIRHGFARRLSAAEGLALLQRARDENLVQFGENVQRRVSFICNCCGCCCEAMIAARHFGFLHPVVASPFLPRVKADVCRGCGRCAAACPVAAAVLVSAHDPKNQSRKLARIDESICLGCGVCVRACQDKAIGLEPRPARVITPVDSTHRIVLMAIERGKLHDLIFDRRVLASHRALAAVLGVILKLPPLKQVIASRQFKSRYLEALLSRRRG